jgi:hypothetical protein
MPATAVVGWGIHGRERADRIQQHVSQSVRSCGEEGVLVVRVRIECKRE